MCVQNLRVIAAFLHIFFRTITKQIHPREDNNFYYIPVLICRDAKLD